MDSAFETACRAFLRHKLKMKLDENHQHRENLVKVVRNNLKDIDSEVWDNISYYYTEIRNDLYHQSAGKTVTDIALLDYQDTVEFVIGRALELSVGQMAITEFDNVIRLEKESPGESPGAVSQKVRLGTLSDRVDKLIVAVAAIQPHSAAEVNEYFKREGDSLRLKPEEFGGMVARNRGSKRFFYYFKEQKCWVLSAAGKFKLGQFGKSED